MFSDDVTITIYGKNIDELVIKFLKIDNDFT